jgi:2',3'-cyclic-nucleotide 2'-phosphodiesterase (5'-nucleotidase family)
VLSVNPGYVTESSAQLAARADLFFRAFSRMHYRAMHVTSHEMAATPEVLIKAARRYKLPLVSSSIIHAKSGKPVFPLVVTRQVGPLRFGFIGAIASPPTGYKALFLERGYDVLDPEEAVRRGVAAAKAEGATFVVLLSAVSRLQIDRVLEKVDGVDVVLGSDSYGLSTELEIAGGSYFADTFSKGKYISELRITPAETAGNYRAADRSASLRSRRAMLAQQVEGLSATLGAEDAAARSPATTRALQAEMARMRAQMGLVDLELKDRTPADPAAGTLALEAHPIAKTIEDDAVILKWVDAYKAQFPSSPSH